MHKASNDQLPENMASIFMRTENYHKNKLKNQNTYFIEVRTYIRKFTINYSGPILWNALTLSLQLISINHLKNRNAKNFY